MFLEMLAVEQKKLLQGRLFWGALALLLLIGGAVFFFMFTTRDSAAFSLDDQMEVTAAVIWPQALWGALLMFAQLGAPIVLAVIGAAVAQEYGWRTVSLWLSHGVPRTTLLVARFLVLVLAVLIFTGALFAVIAAMSAVFTVQITGALEMGQVNWGQALLGILRTAYTLLPYVGLTFFFGVLTRSVVGAIGGGTLYVLIVEPVLLEILGALGGIFLQVRMLLPDLLATSVFSRNEAISPVPFIEVAADAPELLPPGPAAVLIALYTVALLALSIWLFRRQDLSA